MCPCRGSVCWTWVIILLEFSLRSEGKKAALIEELEFRPAISVTIQTDSVSVQCSSELQLSVVFQ